MSIMARRCTCAEREHGCSPPCPAHPELGGGLGNPGGVIRCDCSCHETIEDGGGGFGTPGCLHCNVLGFD